jgi:hypothetical protein
MQKSVGKAAPRRTKDRFIRRQQVSELSQEARDLDGNDQTFCFYEQRPGC